MEVLGAPKDLWRRAEQLAAVVVATPNATHVPLAMSALQRGLGVVVDKPFAPTAAEADALVLVTDWPEYRKLDWPRIAASMRHKVLVDGRNYLDREELASAGFRYIGIGR